MITWRPIASVPVVAAGILVASGCGQPSRSHLHEAAQSLIPPGAKVVLEKDADCVEGARFPSCVEVYFRLEHHRVAERLNLFITNARQHGWKAERAPSAGGAAGGKRGRGSYGGGGGLGLDC